MLVVTDHKPLVQILGDKTLDEISNPRIFSLKQRTLPWRFDIEHMPGEENCFSDATSRNPVGDEVMGIALTEVLAGLCGADVADTAVYIGSNSEPDVRAITWELVKQETKKDSHMLTLIDMIEGVFPEERCEMSPQLERYWDLKDDLYVLEGVILLADKVLIPSSLRTHTV